MQIEIKKHDVLVQAVNGRELHTRLEIGKDYSNWIKVQIERADLTQDVDFVTFAQKGEDSQSKTRIEYYLTIEAAKNIAMLSQTTKGKEVRAYFIECEKKLTQSFKLPNFEDPAEAAIAWAEQFKEKRFALEQLEAAKAQIENDKPAVSFANIVTDSTNARCIRVWVKSMKHENNLTVGEQQVFKWLLDNRYIFRDCGGYLPYSRYEANGSNYFTVTIDEINGKPRRVMKITGKGVVALTGKVVDAFSEIRNGLVLMQGGIK